MANQPQKSWFNVFALRQEYNQHQKTWFPVIFYWNGSDDTGKYWIESLCTETGNSFYHSEAKSGYSAISSPGTDKCNPEHVKAILAEYKSDNNCVFEVQKLGAYRPH